MVVIEGTGQGQILSPLSSMSRLFNTRLDCEHYHSSHLSKLYLFIEHYGRIPPLYNISKSGLLVDNKYEVNIIILNW